jgi:CubicO group peptidase (beta-lactamase class C family)
MLNLKAVTGQRKSMSRILITVFFTINLLILSTPLHAESGKLNRANEMEVFLDALIRHQMHENNIPGATLSLVHENKLVLSKGYGFSDKEKRIKVDPDKTLFRIASISKLFVWTAAMQLVEQGKLDLDADINIYLNDFKIPATFPKAITMRSLMSHSAGFEDKVLGLFSYDFESVRPLHEILIEQMPERVRPVNETTAYSNHGAAIAGYIIEQISGLKWEDYVQRNILKPLGMNNTTFIQPLPENLMLQRSKGYRYNGVESIEQKFIILPLAPAGGGSTTATDISKFMIAHLQNGQFNGSQILKRETAELMHSRSFSNEDSLNGMAHGFFGMDRNGYKIIGHGGDMLWFMSNLFLIPESGTGLFISFNSNMGGYANELIYKEFTDYFFPNRKAHALLKQKAITEEYGLAGYYCPNRFSQSDITKAGKPMYTFEVTQGEPGVIYINRYGVSKWLQTAPLQYRNASSEDRLIFRKNSQGEISHLFFNDTPYIGFDKLTFIGQPGSALGILILFLIPIIFRISAPRIISIINRKKDNSASLKLVPLPLHARFLTIITGVLLLVFLVFLYPLLTDVTLVFFDLSTTIQYSFILPLIACITTVLHIISSLLSWTRQQGHVVNRITHSLLSIGFVVLLLDLYYWNIIGFNF